MDDLQGLVLLAQQRDAGAFAALMERFERAALAAAYAILHNPERAGDAVQEAFLRAWQQLPALKDGGKFPGWLLQIVRNAAIDARRRIRPTLAEFPDLVARGADPLAAADAEDRRRRVHEALDTLDEKTREAVMLRYYEGMAAREIAEVQGVSSAAVDMRLSRGRAVLRERLGDLMEGSEASERRATGERS